MSVAAPLRRISSRCLYCNPTLILSRAHEQQRRTAISDSLGRKKNTGETATKNADGERAVQSNPILEQYLRQNPQRVGSTPAVQQTIEPGDIAASSIFEDQRRADRQAKEVELQKNAPQSKERDPQNSQLVLDPDPNARERWERKKVIQSIRKGGRLTRAQYLKRTEREHLAKSQNLKSSTKKLGMLARQIAGKSLEDAITQMRFSKKKVAQQVLKHLEAARDEAVVVRGMGLGAAASEEDGTQIPDPAATDIQLKDGKRYTVKDLSKIYIDQAWVGKGPYGKLPDYRARGRMFILRTPWTSLSVLLKEETTRVREWQDREEKRRKQRLEKLWVQLPDRPIFGPRGQYYSW